MNLFSGKSVEIVRILGVNPMLNVVIEYKICVPLLLPIDCQAAFIVCYLYLVA